MIFFGRPSDIFSIIMIFVLSNNWLGRKDHEYIKAVLDSVKHHWMNRHISLLKFPSKILRRIIQTVLSQKIRIDWNKFRTQLRHSHYCIEWWIRTEDTPKIYVKSPGVFMSKIRVKRKTTAGCGEGNRMSRGCYMSAIRLALGFRRRSKSQILFSATLMMDNEKSTARLGGRINCYQAWWYKVWHVIEAAAWWPFRDLAR